ncbi:MAG: FAD-binding protein [Bacteroidales bacterium]
MIRILDLTLNPEEAFHPGTVTKKACQAAGISPNLMPSLTILKRSVDARQRPVKVRLQVRLSLGESISPLADGYNWQDVSNAEPVIIVGSGPAGLCAALRLVELGLRPVIVERGRPVEHRKRDIAHLNRNERLDPESNYCFGEGGAGTYSDGKLYTRSRKRGEVGRILEILHLHGAPEEILYDSHPHIGTDRLPGIIANIRATILQCGGEFHFNQRMEELLIREGHLVGIITASGEILEGRAVVLATGHSASDVYELLHRHQIDLDAKGFAMGVRIEHPQVLIDQIQYHSKEGRGKYLPAAEYSLAKNLGGRGVYSFCMCPGGIIVPSATDENQLVVNGMSNSRRNSPFANSGLVVEIRVEDLVEYSEYQHFAGLEYQKFLEKTAHRYGGPGQVAPAQRLADFVAGKSSTSLPDHSYHPGLIPSPVHEWLPDAIRMRLQEGLNFFGRRMKGFLTNEAILVGVESRTSSPVRIIRDPVTLATPRFPGLFPAGEGAGYAGGIVSSAMDGENVALAVKRWLSA